jgi:hypothetical protein
MKAQRFGLAAAVAVVWLGLTGCAGLFVNSDWEQTSNADTEHAYQQFLYEHGDSEFAAEARRRLERIAWEKAEKTNTLAAYEGFQKRYPQGQFASEAEQRVERLKWLECVRANNLEAVQAFLKRFPTGAHAAAAQAKARELTAANEAARDRRRERLAVNLVAGEHHAIAAVLADAKLPESERSEAIAALEASTERTVAARALVEFLCTVPPSTLSVSPRTTITTYTYGASPYSGPTGIQTLVLNPGGTRFNYQDALWQRGAEALWRLSPALAIMLAADMSKRRGDYEQHLQAMLRGAGARLRLELLPGAAAGLNEDDPLIAVAVLGVVGLRLEDREAPAALPRLIALTGAEDESVRSIAVTVLEQASGQKFGADRAAWENWWRQVAPK